MKKTLLLVLGVALLAGGTMTSCKKGANDPFMSFKSRKGRLSGDWALTAKDDSETGSFAGVSYTVTTTHDGAIETETTTSSGISNTVTTNEAIALTINKDGTYTMTATYDNSSTTDSGNWTFLSKNKNGELKKKEAVVFTSTSQSTTSGGTTTTTSNTGFNSGGIMILDQLKSKEAIFMGTITDTDASGDVTTNNYKHTYTKQ